MTRPWWRMRYSSTAYSLGVRSTTFPPRCTSRLPLSRVRSATLSTGGAIALGRLHPSKQLLQGEGLRDVVVGAHFERLHLEVHGVLSGEHQHRHSFAAIAQRAQHLETRQRRQAQVEHEHVVVAAGRKAQPFGAVPDEVGVKPGLGQTALHVLADCLVVFDDEDFHPVGRYTLKFDPTPTCDSTSIRPRCSAMIP